MSDDFIPALRFERLTPMFDAVAAVTVRDGALKRLVLREADVAAGDRVLDVGCGTGTLAAAAARLVSGAAITGLDADPAILRQARRRAAREGLELDFDEAMSTAFPYADSSFDLVLSTLFFHHLTDDDKRRTAAEIIRVLRPGGRLVIGDLGKAHDPAMRLAARVTVQMLDGTATTTLNVRGGLPGLLTAAGFEEVAVRDRMRAPIGSLEVLSAVAPEAAGPR